MITPGPFIIIWIIKTFIVQKIIAYLHPVTYITVTYDVLMFLFCFFIFSKFKGY